MATEQTEPQNPWKAYLLSGIVTALFGLAVLAWPGITLRSLIAVFGAFALIAGAIQVVESLWVSDSSWLLTLVAGAASITVGTLAVVWPGATGVVVLNLIAANALVSGALAIARFLFRWRPTDGRLPTLFSGAVSVAFGIAAFSWPGETATTLAWLIGFYALLSGLSGVCLAFIVRSGRTT